MRRFYIKKQNITGNTAVLINPDARHVKDVLRLGIGDKICVLDGEGSEYTAEITALAPGEVSLVLSEPIQTVAESPARITLMQAFLKDKKMDTLLRQVTELGISCFLPFYADHSVPKPDKNRVKTRHERWEKITRESLKQCRRSVMPEILAAVSFREALDHVKGTDLKIMFWENSNTPMAKMANDNTNPIRSIAILMGPEGGFSTKETQEAVDNGFITLSLGPRILKAETATIAACAVVQHLFGDMG